MGNSSSQPVPSQALHSPRRIAELMSSRKRALSSSWGGERPVKVVRGEDIKPRKLTRGKPQRLRGTAIRPSQGGLGSQLDDRTNTAAVGATEDSVPTIQWTPINAPVKAGDPKAALPNNTPGRQDATATHRPHEEATLDGADVEVQSTAPLRAQKPNKKTKTRKNQANSHDKVSEAEMEGEDKLKQAELDEHASQSLSGTAVEDESGVEPVEIETVSRLVHGEDEDAEAAFANGIPLAGTKPKRTKEEKLARKRRQEERRQRKVEKRARKQEQAAEQSRAQAATTSTHPPVPVPVDDASEDDQAESGALRPDEEILLTPPDSPPEDSVSVLKELENPPTLEESEDIVEEEDSESMVRELENLPYLGGPDDVAMEEDSESMQRELENLALPPGSDDVLEEDSESMQRELENCPLPPGSDDIIVAEDDLSEVDDAHGRKSVDDDAEEGSDNDAMAINKTAGPRLAHRRHQDESNVQIDDEAASPADVVPKRKKRSNPKSKTKVVDDEYEQGDDEAASLADDVPKREKKSAKSKSRTKVDDEDYEQEVDERSVHDSLAEPQEPATRNEDTRRRGKIGGPWSARERVLAEEIWNDVLKREKVDDAVQRQKTVNWAKMGTFKEEMLEAFPDRTLASIRKFCQRTFRPTKSGLWDEDEDNALREAFTRMPEQWAKIALEVGRDAQAVRDRWRNYVRIAGGRKTGAWSVDEEQKLRKVVEEAIEVARETGDAAKKGKRIEASINWNHVCDKLAGTRSAKVCRDKWELLKKRDAKGITSREASAALDAEPSKGKASKDRKLDARFEKLGKGDVYDALVDIVEGAKAQPDGTYANDTTFWSLIALRRQAVSKFVDDGALRRRAYQAALQWYGDKRKVREAPNEPAKAKVMMKYLRKEIDDFNDARKYRVHEFPNGNRDAPLTAEQMRDMKAAKTKKKKLDEWVKSSAVVVEGENDEDDDSFEAQMQRGARSQEHVELKKRYKRAVAVLPDPFTPGRDVSVTAEPVEGGSEQAAESPAEARSRRKGKPKGVRKMAEKKKRRVGDGAGGDDGAPVAAGPEERKRKKRIKLAPIVIDLGQH